MIGTTVKPGILATLWCGEILTLFLAVCACGYLAVSAPPATGSGVTGGNRIPRQESSHAHLRASRRRFGPRAHRAFNVLLFRLLSHAKVIFELEAEPEFGRGPEVARQS